MNRKVKVSFDEIRQERENTFNQMAALNFDDSTMENGANMLALLQKNMEVQMLRHIKEIRNLCKASRLPAFDSGFYKLFSRRPEGKKTERNQINY